MEQNSREIADGKALADAVESLADAVAADFDFKPSFRNFVQNRYNPRQSPTRAGHQTLPASSSCLVISSIFSLHSEIKTLSPDHFTFRRLNPVAQQGRESDSDSGGSQEMNDNLYEVRAESKSELTFGVPVSLSEILSNFINGRTYELW
jgi:hypothetical protein